jgi:hypothetical protein
LLAYLGADLSSGSLDQILSVPLLPLLRQWPKTTLIAWGWLVLMVLAAIVNRLVCQGILHHRLGIAE